MAKTPSQIQAEIRRLQQQQRQAIDKYNREVRSFNAARQKAIDEHNRQVRAHNAEVDRQKRERSKAITSYNQAVRAHNAQVRKREAATKQAIANYNREVRAYNSKVQASRQSRQAAISRLQSRQVTGDLATYRDTAVKVYDTFERLEGGEAFAGAAHEEVRQAAERESQRTIETANMVLGDEAPPSDIEVANDDAEFVAALTDFSEELATRWQGATYAMSPANPDAARHFCTSVREIFTTIIEVSASDADVLAANPDCKKAPNGVAPSRRSKLEFLIGQKDASASSLADFVEANIENVIALFTVFNKATHGAAGKYSMEMLRAIRTRVRESTLFLLSVAT